VLRVVLDVNVLVSAAIGRTGPLLELLRVWRDGAFEVVVSPKLLAELERVLSRDVIASRADPTALAALTAALHENAIRVDDPAAAERVVQGDARDDYLVVLARAARAHAIVTGDRHLFEAELEAIRVIGPADFIALVVRLPE
jgi:putative PIN family toxin of toxin-antitoxin system